MNPAVSLELLAGSAVQVVANSIGLRDLGLGVLLILAGGVLVVRY